MDQTKVEQQNKGSAGEAKPEGGTDSKRENLLTDLRSIADWVRDQKTEILKNIA